MYALPYVAIEYPLVFLIMIRFWSVSKTHGYVTAADFVRARFGSPTLALAVAVTGIVATMPYIALNLPIEESKNVWKIYDEVARESGYEAGPAERGYLIRCHVAETEEKAIRNAREFMWMQGEFTGLKIGRAHV